MSTEQQTPQTFFVVTWVENHPDRISGVIGVFTSQTEADDAVEACHKEDQQTMAQRGYPGRSSYHFSCQEYTLGVINPPG